MDSYRFTAGTTPLLVSMPHGGTHIPAEIAGRLSAAGLGLADTDWHLAQLYDFLDDLGAARLEATHSRTVIDLNRAPDDAPLYPGARTTELCPLSSFAEEPLYRAGAEPDGAEIESRRARFWQPYHDRLAAELAAIKARHGIALLWDAHSIRSRVPRLFQGRLPDLNFGTNAGASAAASLVTGLVARAERAEGYSRVLDGRFKGGFITRSHGDPGKGVHAVQLELSQITYMDEDPPYAFRDDLAAGIRPVLRRLLAAALAWAGEVTWM